MNLQPGQRLIVFCYTGLSFDDMNNLRHTIIHRHLNKKKQERKEQTLKVYSKPICYLMLFVFLFSLYSLGVKLNFDLNTVEK